MFSKAETAFLAVPMILFREKVVLAAYIEGGNLFLSEKMMEIAGLGGDSKMFCFCALPVSKTCNQSTFVYFVK